MRSLLMLIAVAIVSLGMLGCGGTTPNTNASNTKAGNANNPLETTKKQPEEVKNNAPTMTPVVKAYCDAWTKNDEGALRKVYSAASLKEFEADMKAEKAKRLIDFLKSDKITGKTCEASNEQITGDRAVVTFKADTYPTGIKLVFVKENGEWKLTNEMPDFDAVKKAQPAPNSNAVK
ncbi:MAG: nuclear transport factor 2 family protein [Pyrinomonadaceae bacterium]|nr:nuclear transport factor 2 family protein [Pyrinomonadaceae bacterium]